jgi:hypothetical protein
VTQEIVAVLLLFSGTVLCGQSASKRSVLMKAGVLFEARSGRMLSNQAILIEGDRIKEVGDAAAVVKHAPPEARLG